MKISEVGIDSTTRDILKSHELVSVNYTSLLNDFDKNFGHQNLELDADGVTRYKGQMFMAFCMGAVAGVDPKSNFRENYNLPQSVLDELNKTKIKVPDKKIII
jgi:hypothetical protein